MDLKVSIKNVKTHSFQLFLTFTTLWFWTGPVLCSRSIIKLNCKYDKSDDFLNTQSEVAGQEAIYIPKKQ